MGPGLTWVGDIVQGGGENFEGTGEGEKVHLIVEGEENLDGLRRIASFLNCTHLEG